MLLKFRNLKSYEPSDDDTLNLLLQQAALFAQRDAAALAKTEENAQKAATAQEEAEKDEGIRQVCGGGDKLGIILGRCWMVAKNF